MIIIVYNIISGVVVEGPEDSLPTESPFKNPLGEGGGTPPSLKLKNNVIFILQNLINFRGWSLICNKKLMSLNSMLIIYSHYVYY